MVTTLVADTLPCNPTFRQLRDFVYSFGVFKSIESQDPTGLQGLPLIWVAGKLREHGIL